MDNRSNKEKTALSVLVRRRLSGQRAMAQPKGESELSRKERLEFLALTADVTESDEDVTSDPEEDAMKGQRYLNYMRSIGMVGKKPKSQLDAAIEKAEKANVRVPGGPSVWERIAQMPPPEENRFYTPPSTPDSPSRDIAALPAASVPSDDPRGAARMALIKTRGNVEAAARALA